MSALPRLSTPRPTTPTTKRLQDLLYIKRRAEDVVRLADIEIEKEHAHIREVLANAPQRRRRRARTPEEAR